MSRDQQLLWLIYNSPQGAAVIDRECAGGYCGTDDLVKFGRDVLKLSESEITEVLKNNL